MTKYSIKVSIDENNSFLDGRYIRNPNQEDLKNGEMGIR